MIWLYIYVSCPFVSDSWQPHGLLSARLLYSWNFPCKSPGVGCHFLLQGIFPTKGSNPGLPHYRQTLYHLSHQALLCNIRSLKKKKRAPENQVGLSKSVDIYFQRITSKSWDSWGPGRAPSDAPMEKCQGWGAPALANSCPPPLAVCQRHPELR